MDFIDEVRTRSDRFAKRVEHLDTEEATKNALVLPFIQMLGYEIFDPTEVIPEFTADVGTKKGEKVDFALMQGGKPAVLIEAKMLGTKLEDTEMSQLLRYFTVTETRVGILTDGIRYRFFSDLDQPNVMDSKPFFEFNMLDFTEAQVKELKRFHKTDFSLDEIVETARELKYTTEIKRLLARELAQPSDDFVRFVIRQVYDGQAYPAIRVMFESLTHSAFNQFINERINDRLKSALDHQDHIEDEDPVEHEEEEEGEPEFAPRELEALSVIRAIVAGQVDTDRLGLRATKTYCSVILHDDETRSDYGRRLCRLWVRSENLRVTLHNESERYSIESIGSLYDYADQIRMLTASLDETTES